MVLRGAWVVVFLLAAGLTFSGCSGPASQTASTSGVEGTIDQSHTAAPTEVAADKGNIEGVVVNENAAPLKGVNLALLGTPLSAFSDKQGNFRFDGVAPGAYTLRANSAGYHALEDEVTVEAGQVTTIHVTLIDADNRGAGSREHLHDYWDGQTRRLLFEGSVQHLPGPEEGGKTNYACTNSVTSGPCYALPIFPEDGRFVYPGTASMDITVDWQKKEFVKTVVFRYTPANGRTPDDLVIEPAKTRTLAVAPEMADHGHQLFSLWTFELIVQPKVGDAVILSQATFNKNFVGSFDVKMEIVKGAVPSEPPHPAFWTTSNRITVIPQANVTFTCILLDCNRADPRSTDSTNSGTNNVAFALPAKTIVPPGTTRLEVIFDYAAKTTGGVDLTDKVTPKTLTFRTGEINPKAATYADHRVEEPLETSVGHRKWDLALIPDEADAFYQTKSLWQFAIGDQGKERETTHRQDCPYACTWKFTLTVVAINDDYDPDAAQAAL